jgi:hypothetical protein
MPVYPTPGPAPKPASKRRRRNTPRSYGAAKPTTAPAAPQHDRELGSDDPHPLVVSMWDAVQSSCESAFYSEADWQRLRFETVEREQGDDQWPADLRAHLGRRAARPDRAAAVAGGEAPRRDRGEVVGPG